MDLCFEEVLEQWCLYHAPFLLQDPELFTRLLEFIHALAVHCLQEERRAITQRFLTPSRS
jgi:hypothetical protein